jgi:hypothetical protein
MVNQRKGLRELFDPAIELFTSLYLQKVENQSVTSLRDIRIKVRNRFDIEMDIGGGKLRCGRLTNDQIVVSCRTI